MIGKSIMTLSAVAVGALALAVSVTLPVDARGGHGGGGGHHGGGGGSFRGGGGGGHVAFRSAPAFRSVGVVHHRHHVRYAPTRVYSYGYADSCGGLRQRALVTGSRYWWQRYYDCRGGHY